MEAKKITQNDVYTLITNRIIEHLEKGVVPWKQPWSEVGLPQNLITKKAYTGINTLLLASLGYDQNFFLTFKQLKDLGGSVLKGERSCPVVFWKWSEIEDKGKPGEKKKVSMIRYYTVFNIQQCVGIPLEKIPLTKKEEPNRMVKLEGILDDMPNKPKIRHVENEAYYSPSKDYINMPKMNNFETAEGYYSTLSHELIHSTGHTSRLNRKGVMEDSLFGSEMYSQEELVAEIGATYLNSYTGICQAVFENNVAYMQSWLKILKDDNRLIIFAASQAQRAVDYILNLTTDVLTKPDLKTSA